MSYKNFLIAVLLLVVGWFGWTVLNLAIENDGLRQVAAGHKQSIESLLDYVSIATKSLSVNSRMSARAAWSAASEQADGNQAT